jgi:hypothetical protein
MNENANLSAGKDMWVRTGDLIVDRVYQREPNVRTIAKMAAHWRPELAGVLEVSRRADGHYVVLDGQHRLLAARAAGVEHVRCLVHEHLTPKQEAAMFVDLNTQRTRPKSSAIFNGNLAAGDPVALAIEAAVITSGAQVARPSNGSNAPWNHIRATAALERIFDTGGRALLEATVRVLGEAFPEDKLAYSAAMMIGCSSVIYAYGSHPNFSIDAFTERLAAAGARRIDQAGKSYPATSGSAGASNSKGTVLANAIGHRWAMVRAYNARARKRLPDLTQSNMKQLSMGNNPWAAWDEKAEAVA